MHTCMYVFKGKEKAIKTENNSSSTSMFNKLFQITH